MIYWYFFIVIWIIHTINFDHSNFNKINYKNTIFAFETITEWEIVQVVQVLNVNTKFNEFSKTPRSKADSAKELSSIISPTPTLKNLAWVKNKESQKEVHGIRIKWLAVCLTLPIRKIGPVQLRMNHTKMYTLLLRIICMEHRKIHMNLPITFFKQMWINIHSANLQRTCFLKLYEPLTLSFMQTILKIIDNRAQHLKNRFFTIEKKIYITQEMIFSREKAIPNRIQISCWNQFRANLKSIWEEIFQAMKRLTKKEEKALKWRTFWLDLTKFHKFEQKRWAETNKDHCHSKNIQNTIGTWLWSNKYCKKTIRRLWISDRKERTTEKMSYSIHLRVFQRKLSHCKFPISRRTLQRSNRSHKKVDILIFLNPKKWWIQSKNILFRKNSFIIYLQKLSIFFWIEQWIKNK